MNKKDNNEKIKNKKNISEPIVEDVFESQKEFIVLGLVGKTGSGVSTVSDILNSNFSNLNLPQPCEESHANNEKTEYRLLYNFANKNWRKFYKIKTSSLIVTSALNKGREEFVNYLCKFLDKKNEKAVKNEIKDAVNDLYDYSISFDINNIGLEWLGDKQINITNFFNNFTEDIKNLDSSIKPKVDETNKTVQMSISEINKLFYIYKKSRMDKDSLNNYLFYEFLCKYVYEYLPIATEGFWTKLSKIIRNNIKILISVLHQF